MANDKYHSLDAVALAVREALSRGASVDIDGLGLFRKTPKGYRFQPLNQPRVFIAYVHEDFELASRLFDALHEAGLDPWLDRRKLLPGQNWARAIQNAMETSDFAVACFSRSSLRKRGGFQAEIRYAIECARRIPLGEVFLVPIRLEECPVPLDVAREVQYLDLFPDWLAGVEKLISTIRDHAKLKLDLYSTQSKGVKD